MRRLKCEKETIILTNEDDGYLGIGCLIAWGIWFIMFVLLLIDRHKRER